MTISNKPADHLEKARGRFLPLLLTNPNYFGNLSNSPFQSVTKIVSNTTYEELKCIGFNPEQSRLEAVVWIKQPSGYDGGLCSQGSLEYVSFYLSYDNGVTWLFQGTAHFQAFDVNGPHPLEYAVSLTVAPPRKLCVQNNLPLARGILSWNVPPAGPTTPPVWGNVLDATIQIAPIAYQVPLLDLLDAASANLAPNLATLVAADATVKMAPPIEASVFDLKDLYAKTNVAPHRLLHSAIGKALKNPATLAVSSAYFKGLGFDVAAVLAGLEETSGSTQYEQLGCIGLDEGTGSPDALLGTLLIKRPTGYLGNPCTKGSLEYVAFWIDWGNGWQWAGTSSVGVHDIANIPAEGLSYGVYLPVDLNSHRKPCDQGPVTAKVRAILSWETPPPPSNPNYIPVWGNRLETTILVDPGVASTVGDFTPYLTSICDVAICDIDQKSGWAHPGAGDSPFGAFVSIYGYIPGAPLFSNPLLGQPRYQIAVQPIDTATHTFGAQQMLTDPFQITVTQQIGGGTVTSSPLTQNASGGFFTYQDATPNPGVGWRIISPQGLLGVWNSSALTGTWLITVTAWDATMTTMYLAGSVQCTLDGTTRQGVVIDLDQAAPVTDLQITGYMPGGVGPCQSAVNCQTFTVGDVICGSYTVTDDHLGSFSLSAEPTLVSTSGFTVDGSVTHGESYPALPLSGTKAGVWTYDTAGLPPCGYTIQLSTIDRTIVDCGPGWRNDTKFVGFCLVAAKPGA